MTRNRAVLLVLVVTGALAWALPAAAHRTLATKIGVTAGMPSEFRFRLSSTKTIKKGTTVTFVVTNQGTLPHDFKIAGKVTPLLQTGKKANLKITFKKAGRYPYLCTVSGHAAAGMKGVLVVK